VSGGISLLLACLYFFVAIVGLNEAGNYTATKSFTNIAIPATIAIGPLVTLIFFGISIAMFKSFSAANKGALIPILVYLCGVVIVAPLAIAIGFISISEVNEPHIQKATEQKTTQYSEEKKIEEVKKIVEALKTARKSTTDDLKICILGDKDSFAVIKSSEDCTKTTKLTGYNSLFEIFVTDKKPSYSTTATKEIYIKLDNPSNKVIYYAGDKSEKTFSFKD